MEIDAVCSSLFGAQESSKSILRCTDFEIGRRISWRVGTPGGYQDRATILVMIPSPSISDAKITERQHFWNDYCRSLVDS